MIGFVFKRLLARVALLAIAAAGIVLLYADPGADGVLQGFVAQLTAIVRGDLGSSVGQGSPVLAMILQAAPVTLAVAGASLALTLVVGLPLGIAGGVWRGTILETLIVGLARIGAAALHIWVGMLLLLLFALTLRLLPPGGFVPFAENPAAAVRSLVLPVLALALPQGAALALRIRCALRAGEDADFMLAARAQGMTRQQAARRYGVAAAMPVALDGLGRQFAVMVAAVIVIEAVFFLPGLGRMTVSALIDGDQPLLRGGLLAMLALVTSAALIGDLFRALMGGAAAPEVLPDARPKLRFGFWFGLLIVVALCGLSAAAQFWSPFPAGLPGEAAAPSVMQPLGTDAAGRDMFAAVMAGLGTSITVAMIGAAVGVILGTPIGLVTGVVGGAFASVTFRAGDAVTAIPLLLVAIALFPAIGANAVNTTILLGLVFVPPVAAAVHRAVRQRLGHGYVAAARLAGLSRWSAASRHVFPELGRTIVAKAVGLVGVGMLGETVLSFAGLGVRAPTASIGLLLADAQARFLQFPHLVLIPGAVLLVFVVAINLVADAIEPEPQRQGGAHAVA